MAARPFATQPHRCDPQIDRPGADPARSNFAEDFGFKHLLWVYSGRRGIHLWISDPAALALSDDQRKAIVNYVELIKGGAKMDKKVDLKRPLHPSIARAQGVLRPYFEKVVLQDQNCFVNDEQWDTVLRILPDKRTSSNSPQFNTHLSN